MSICIFGDSITYGAFDLEKGGWVNRLKLYLENNCFDEKVYNLGISGDNTNSLLKRLENDTIFREPNIIIFAIGINDSLYLAEENHNNIPIKYFEKNIKELIIKAKKLVSEIIFIGITPVDEDKTNPTPWDINKIYNNSYIKNYNNIVKEVCQKESIEFIDLYDRFKREDYKNLLYDGLHPSSKGHELIFEAVKECFDKVN